ncbi:phosphopantetheine-binding protein [Nostoc sp. CHAB 5715]|uniref:phosphopantetheine-binding protein n=1 Tax=Nostoc sp. CHAB 5715 TaxID=2780400 RepID=UPI00226FCB23|nr:phosphopantetheine-binding protein [Nostoc sp. CHAB 5715]
MAVETAVPDELKHSREESLKKGIRPQEGVDAFNRILRSGLPQVVVSTQDFQSKWEQNHFFKPLEELTLLEDKSASVSLSKQSHPRPNLRNDYVTPRNEVEVTIAKVWQHLLGIKQIGIHDNFFELGGDSLLATQIFSRLLKEFQINLSLHSFFEAPTIIEQALIIEQSRSSGEKSNVNMIKKIERIHEPQILASFDNISEQQVDLLLSKFLAEKGLEND